MSRSAAEPAGFGPIGVGTPSAEVLTVVQEGIAAVVSDVPLEVLDATRDNVLAHERVNAAVMRSQTVMTRTSAARSSAALRDVCVASRANRPIGDKVIVTAAFLVERKREYASTPA
jgi:hypothetical protein